MRSDSLGFKLAVVTRYSLLMCVVILGPIWLLGTLSGSKMIQGWWYLVYAAELFLVIGGMLFTFSAIIRNLGLVVPPARSRVHRVSRPRQRSLFLPIREGRPRCSSGDVGP